MKVKLSDLYDIGSSKRVFQSEWQKSGVPFYRAREIAKLSIDGYVDNELFINEDLYLEYINMYGKPEAGDVMVTGVGTLGVCYIVKPEDRFYFKDGNILWFKQKAKDRILSEYLVKAFDSKEAKEFIDKNSSGTTVGTFTIQTAKKMEISLPSIQEQRNIIQKITKIESVIKQRRQQLQLLDTLIKARFVELFGDPEMNPMGWEQVTLNDVCSSIVRGPFGSALKKEFFVEPDESTYKVYEQKHAIQKSATIGTYYITEEKYQELKRFECLPGDILMSCSGTMGELYQLPDGCEKGVINQALCKFTLNEKILPICFLVYMKQTIGNLETKGSGIQNIAAVSYVKQMPINLPPMGVQNEFEQFVKQVDKSKVAVQKALDETQLLFDSLMQQYFG